METPFYTSSKYSACYGCEVRQIGCHQYCEIYLDERKQAAEQKDNARKKKREAYITISNNKIRRKIAINRWYRKYGV